MTLAEISNFRVLNQQVSVSNFKTAEDIVGWMGAMQAQDFNMAKWAIGIRLKNSTHPLIETAIDKGEILRTHLLRPTWHFVSPDDIYWMLDLSAPQIKTLIRSRDKVLELNEAIYRKSNAIIENALSGGKYLTRDEICAELKKTGIATDQNRAAHLLMRAELDKIICSGKTKGNNQTYALLTERVLQIKTLHREEALAQLAKKYFTSHSPATLQDFAWWSGLSVTESKQALEMIKSRFISETIGKQTYWLSNSFSLPKPGKESAFLLPAYDEFIISYRDRVASLPFGDQNKAVSNNGIFRPVILINGQVKGIWKRTIKKDKIIIEAQFFQPVNRATKIMIEKASLPLGHFFNKKIEIRHSLY